MTLTLSAEILRSGMSMDGSLIDKIQIQLPRLMTSYTPNITCDDKNRSIAMNMCWKANNKSMKARLLEFTPRSNS